MCHIPKWPPVYAKQPRHLNLVSHDSHVEFNGRDWRWSRVTLELTTTTNIRVKVPDCCSNISIWSANSPSKPDLCYYSRCWGTMQNTWFGAAIFLRDLTTAIMGVKLPDFIIDIPVHCFLSEHSLRSHYQSMAMQLQPSLADQCLLVGHLER